MEPPPWISFSWLNYNSISGACIGALNDRFNIITIYIIINIIIIII